MHKIIRTQSILFFSGFLVGCCINKGRLSYQLELANISTECSSRHQGESPDDALMTTGAFSRNIGKLFSELKLVTANLFI